MPKPITQTRLKQLVTYNPETGCFIKIATLRQTGSVEPNGYVRIYLEGQRYLAHRIAFLYMEGDMPAKLVDHKNRVRHDNRWDNLRHATYGDNARNRAAKGVNVTIKHENGRTYQYYQARIMVDGERHSLGNFKNYDDALNARKQAEIEYGAAPI